MGKKRKACTYVYMDDHKSWRKLKEALPEKVYNELHAAFDVLRDSHGCRCDIQFKPMNQSEAYYYGSSYDIYEPRDIIELCDNVQPQYKYFMLKIYDTVHNVDKLYVFKRVLSFRMKAWILSSLSSTLRGLKDAEARTKLQGEINRIKKSTFVIISVLNRNGDDEEEEDDASNS